MTYLFLQVEEQCSRGIVLQAGRMEMNLCIEHQRPLHFNRNEFELLKKRVSMIDETSLYYWRNEFRQ